MNQPTALADTASGEADLPSCPPGRLPEVFAQAAGRMHRLFLENFDPAVTATLSTSLSTAFISAGQSSFQTFLEEHKSAACVIALGLAPLNECALLSLSPEFVFKVLDILTATPASAASSDRRTVTAIELHILQEVFDLFAASLRKTWQPVYPQAFDIVAVGFEHSSQTLSEQGDQTAVVLKSVAQIDDRQGGFEIALPGFLFRLVESRTKDNSADDRVGAHVEENLLLALGASLLDLECVLHGCGVRMSELLRIRPGQILSLGAPADSRFECLVNGKPRFTGEMAASGGRSAFRIGSSLSPV